MHQSIHLIHPWLFISVVLISLTSCGPSVPEDVEAAYATLPEVIDYNFDVKPILADRCYTCHGPDEMARKAGLRLDDEESAFAVLTSGNYAFVKGKPGKSAVFHRILSEDPEVMMPPPDSRLTLSAREKAILIRWMKQGSEWKPHWAFIPLERPGVPESPIAWEVINPIDNFIHAKLLEKGFTPGQPAEKEVLLRRVTMDLTGLPPTPDEINDFLNDESEEAYERVVDRLLASPAHAERLTMEWLDVARYADSHGVSFDGFRTSWPWRDWVIGAFESNMPYDQFLTEQLAGDLLENASKDQIIATSFLRMGQLEGGFGSLPEEFRVEYVLERTALVGTTMLGLTVECARCHDHKFDPISQKEFYQLSAFFNNTVEMGLGPLDGDRAPTLYLFDPEEERNLDSLGILVADNEIEFQHKRDDIFRLANYMESFRMPVRVPDLHALPLDELKNTTIKDKKGKKREVVIVDGNKKAEAKEGVTLTKGRFGNAMLFDDEYDYLSIKDAGLFDTYEPFSASVWVRTDREGKGPTQTVMGNSNNYAADYRGWDLFLDSAMHLTARLIHRLPDDYIEVKTESPVPSGTWTHVGLTYDGSGTADGLRLFVNGELQPTHTRFDHLTRSVRPISDNTLDTIRLPLRIGRSYRIWTFDVGLFEGAIDEVHLAHRQLSRVEMRMLGHQESSEFSGEEQREHLMLHDPEFISRRDALARVRTQQRQILDTAMQLMVMEEMDEPRPSFILDRGVYDQPREQVAPGVPENVLQWSEDFRPDRLGLADWLVDRNNPLTARVAVNRYWQMIFGKGLVRTAEDFGVQGEKPTHPDLLDWLADEFVVSGWDLRHMLKLMVMSSAYRQSAYIPDQMLEMDPENEYYARGPSYRWPAEFLRDNVLAASGLLVREVGGPPVKPYQPEGLWKELEFSSYQGYSYKRDSNDALYRRSLYTFQRRFIPPPFMATFDAASREYCSVRRETTNSPLQALALMNDPQIVEASRILSERVLREESDPDKQIILAYRLTTGISPTDNQLATLRRQYNQSMNMFSNDAAAADSLLSVGDMPYDESLDKQSIAAMAMVANTIFNFDDHYMKR